MEDLIDRENVTILIVDDNQVSLRSEQALVEKNGFRTAAALDGAECVKMAKELQPDLILLDIYMPVMDGLEACRALKQAKETKDIPVIFVTANMDDETLRKTFESGGADYVRKPVNKVELLARINAILVKKKLMETLFQQEKLKGALEMAGAVCHEMNQPLQVIKGYSQLLMMDVPEGAPSYQTIQKMVTQVDKMADITRKLMGITRYMTKDYAGQMKIIDIDRASL